MSVSGLSASVKCEGSSLIVQDVRELVGHNSRIGTELVAAAVRGWSINTRRAFRSDLKMWGRWRRHQRVLTAEADASVVAAWIWALSGGDKSPETVCAIATIERYLVNVGWAYRMAGLDDPTAAPLVRLEKNAAGRQLGARQRQAHAIRFKGDISDLDSPASGVCLSHLLKACRRDLLGARDLALLRTAYDSGARRSELVAARIEYIEGPNEEGAGTLFIPNGRRTRKGRGPLPTFPRQP